MKKCSWWRSGRLPKNMRNDCVKKTVETYNNWAKMYALHRYYQISRIEKDLRFFINNIRKDKILDVGCGAGHDSYFFDVNKFKVVGIDLADQLLNLAHRKVPHADFRKMDIRKPTFPNEYFDGIWMSASFLHIPKKQALPTLRKMFKILQENGLLYVNVEKGEQEKILSKKEYGYLPRMVAFYSPEEFTKLVTDSGFKIMKVVIDEDIWGWIRIFAVK